MADSFIQYYKSKQKPKISFSKDTVVSDKSTIFPRPLGTGGAIKNAENFIGRKEPFLVLNGDILTNIDYAELVKKTQSQQKKQQSQ
jgi:NDP-sugar pyrophosphorylase family protein